MKSEDKFLVNWAGKIVEAFGVAGAMFTIFFDRIARGLFQEMGWAQILGVIVFASLALLGVALDRFLQTVKDMFEI